MVSMETTHPQGHGERTNEKGTDCESSSPSTGQSLEELVGELEALTGVNAVAAADPVSDVATYTLNTKVVARGHAAAIGVVPDTLTITTRLNAHESIEAKLGMRLAQISATVLSDPATLHKPNLFSRSRRRMKSHRTESRVVLSDISGTSPLTNLWSCGAEIFLVSVNSKPCTSLQQTHILIAKARSSTTVTMECQVQKNDPDDEDSSSSSGSQHQCDQQVVHQVLVYKPTIDTPLGIRLGNVQQPLAMTRDVDDTVEQAQQRPPVLVVQETARNSLIGSGLIRKGHVVLSLQGQPCQDMDCDDATNYLQNTIGWVSIIVAARHKSIRDTSNWWNPKAVLPSSPSLLLTSPTRVVQSCRDKLEMMTLRHGKNDIETMGSTRNSPKTQPSLTATSSSEDDKSLLGDDLMKEDGDAIRARAAAIIAHTDKCMDKSNEKSSVKDRLLQNFGIPLLDARGDQQANATDNEFENTEAYVEVQSLKDTWTRDDDSNNSITEFELECENICLDEQA